MLPCLQLHRLKDDYVVQVPANEVFFIEPLPAELTEQGREFAETALRIIDDPSEVHSTILAECSRVHLINYGPLDCREKPEAVASAIAAAIEWKESRRIAATVAAQQQLASKANGIEIARPAGPFNGG